MTTDSAGPRGRAIATLMLLTVAATFAGPWAVASREDIGQPADALQGTGLTETTRLSAPAATIDFEALATGPTTMDAITQAYTGSVLASLGWTTRTGTGEYSFQMNGKALAPNPDGSGGLYIVGESVDTTFGNPDTLTIGLSAPVTQFGFDISDWAGPINIAVSLDSAPVGTLQVDSSSGDIDHFFEAGSAFDEVQITLLPDNPTGNWAISGLYVPRGAPMIERVPALMPAGMVLLSLALVLMSLLVARGRPS